MRVDYQLGLGIGLRFPFSVDVEHASKSGSLRHVSIKPSKASQTQAPKGPTTGGSKPPPKPKQPTKPKQPPKIPVKPSQLDLPNKSPGIHEELTCVRGSRPSDRTE